jgi:flagellar hook-associated protein 2
MASIGSASKIDGIELQMLSHAAPMHANAIAPPAPQAEASQDATTDTRISKAGRLISTATAVLAAAAHLTRDETWAATKAVSSDASTVEASAPSAPTRQHQVQVDALATAQVTSSAVFSPLSTVIGIGTLSIELGSWDASQSNFVANLNWPKATLTVGPRDDSLERIRDKINAAGIGVIATVVSSAAGSRLVLRSTATGAANGFKVDATTDNPEDAKVARSLSTLNFDPAAAQGESGMALLQTAQDARLKIDGRDIQASENLIQDSASGLTLALKAADARGVRIDVVPDSGTAQRRIASFAQAYNDLSKQLSSGDQQAGDAITSTASEIQQQVHAMFVSPTGEPTAMAIQMADIGIHMGQQGLLNVDQAQLGQALSQQPDHVRQLFAGRDENTPGGQGIAAQLTDSPIGASALADAKPSHHTPAPSSGLHTRGPAEMPQTTAGALYHLKLLEQYGPDGATGSDSKTPSKHDDELTMSAIDA